MRILLVALLFLAQENGPRTIQVDAASKADPADGSPGKPFRLLTDAVQAAKGGDILLIAPGLYPGDVTLKPDLLLRGGATEEERKPVLYGSLSAADGCIVEDLVVRPPDAETVVGITGITVDRFTLRNVTVRDLKEFGRGHGHVVGMDFWNCTRLFVSGCRVTGLTEIKWGSACGIRLIRCQARLTGNLIQGISESDWGSAYGLLLVHSTGEVVRNIIADIRETMWDDSCGIKLHSCRDIVVRNNTVAGIKADSWDNAFGIYADLDCAGVIENNIVSDVDRGTSWQDQYLIAGIYSGSDEVVVRHNALHKAGPSILRKQDPTNVELDPGFAKGGEFRLSPASACRRNGNPKVKNEDGTRSDLGAWGGPASDPYPAVDPEVIRKARAEVEKLRGDEAGDRAAAAVKLRALGKAALPVLAEAARDADAEVASTCRNLAKELGASKSSTGLVELLLRPGNRAIREAGELAVAPFEEKLVLFYALSGSASDRHSGKTPLADLMEMVKHADADHDEVITAIWKALPPEAQLKLDSKDFGRDANKNPKSVEDLLRKIRQVLPKK